MREKIIRYLVSDIIISFILIFCLSRIPYIVKNSPVMAVMIPFIWFLFGGKFIYRKDLYGGLIDDFILNRCGLICIIIGVLSLAVVLGLFIF